MRFGGLLRLIAAIGLVAAGPLAAQPMAEADASGASSAAPLATAPAAPVEEAKVEGFRSAQFGMTDAQVRQAIRKDFAAQAERIAVEVNPAEKTTVLSVQVPDLIPNSGRARVSYILGYTSKKLIQVNVVWTVDAKTGPNAETVVGTANLLRNYFLAGGYKPDSVIANRQLPAGYLVFRGADARGRMVVLLLSGSTAPAGEGEKPPPVPVALQLSYIAEPDRPDIYQVPKGAF